MSRIVDAFIVFAVYFMVFIVFVIRDSYKFLLHLAIVIMISIAYDAIFVIASNIW
jgi:hypothetical protein